MFRALSPLADVPRPLSLHQTATQDHQRSEPSARSHFAEPKEARPRRRTLLGSSRPWVVRKPTAPKNAAGVLREPPKSLLVASQHCLGARAAAEPPLEPPAVLPGAGGEVVVGNSSLKIWDPAPNSGTLVFPTTTAPIDSRIRTTGSLPVGISPACNKLPLVKRTSETLLVSFSKIGSRGGTLEEDFLDAPLMQPYPALGLEKL